MAKNYLPQEVEALIKRLRKLEQRVDESARPDAELWQELWAELNVSVEELMVSGEELRQQNDELWATRQALEEERQRYQALYQFAPDGYLVTDTAGNIQEANRAAAQMLNQSAASLMGKPLVLFVTKEERERFHTRLDQLASGERRRIEEWEVWLRPVDASPFPAILTVGVAVDKEDEDSGLRWLLHNATKRKRAEAERESAYQRLEMLHQLDQAILSGETVETIAQIALRYLRRLKPWYQAGVIVIDREQQIARPASFLDADGTPLSGDWSWPLALFKHLTTLQQGHTRIVEDIEAVPDPGPLEQRLLAGGVRAYLGIPLRAGTELLGVLVVGQNSADSFTAGEREILDEAAVQLAIAILQTRLRHQVRHYTAGLEERVVQQTDDLRQEREALRESQARLQGIISTATDAIITVDSQQRIILFNEAATKIFGYPAAEVMGRPLSILLPQEVHERHAHHIAHFGETGETSRSMGKPGEVWGRRADGSIFPIEAMISQVTVSGQRFYTVILRDVTARKQIETEREALFAEVSQQREQLRQLARQVVTAEEEERGRLSRELHDEAGQGLTALKYSLASILSNLPTNGDNLVRKTAVMRHQLTQAIELCETTMQQIRMVAHDLRPTTLDNVGLNLTLEGFCRDFAQRTALPIHYAGIETASLGNVTDITLYRFLQEALTNVARHAEAEQVWVNLHVDAEEVSLSVEDDGRGYDVQPVRGQTGRSKRGIGLLGIRERLEPLQGWLEIDSTPGKGTLVIVHIPR